MKHLVILFLLFNCVNTYAQDTFFYPQIMGYHYHILILNPDSSFEHIQMHCLGGERASGSYISKNDSVKLIYDKCKTHSTVVTCKDSSIRDTVNVTTLDLHDSSSIRQQFIRSEGLNDSIEIRLLWQPSVHLQTKTCSNFVIRYSSWSCFGSEDKLLIKKNNGMHEIVPSRKQAIPHKKKTILWEAMRNSRLMD